MSRRHIRYQTWSPDSAVAWTSPEAEPGFPATHPATQLVASWQAETPQGTSIEVSVRVRTGGGYSPWYALGRWCSGDDPPRGSVPGQRDDLAVVDVDTLVVARGFDAWQLRVLSRRGTGSADPVLHRAGAMVCATPGDGPDGTARSPVRGIILDVPASSQRLHSGAYPEWSGGGDAWCSPTSTSMVLRYFGAGPAPDDSVTAWVDAAHPDRFVPHAVRGCYDHGAGMAGNWSFNTAYAATFGMEAFVTRLRSLDEAERFVAAGIPLVASLPVDGRQLAGAGYTSAGHLLVIVGFTDAGDVVVNDPAAPTNAEVRRTYDRAQFARAWLGKGTVYVIRPPAVPLPDRPDEPNW